MSKKKPDIDPDLCWRCRGTGYRRGVICGICQGSGQKVPELLKRMGISDDEEKPPVV